MKIATLNINSINAHLPALINWLLQVSPDIVFLQEIKTDVNGFPFLELQMAGFYAEVLGQKGYNGVAILSKKKLGLNSYNLPCFDNSESRYLEMLLDNKICLVSVYMPNGNPKPSDKFDQKLAFMKAFNARAKSLLFKYDYVVLGGDFNVILEDTDVFDPQLFKNNALTDECARGYITALKYMGYYDAYRMVHEKDSGYTYWDYGARSFDNDFGMRIDYFFVSPKMCDCLKNCSVDKSLRAAERPSDHTALVADFDLGEEK